MKVRIRMDWIQHCTCHDFVHKAFYGKNILAKMTTPKMTKNY